MTKEINTTSLFQSILEAQKYNVLPPVEKWDPPLCENVDMKIARVGKWYFMNSLISREKASSTSCGLSESIMYVFKFVKSFKYFNYQL